MKNFSNTIGNILSVLKAEFLETAKALRKLEVKKMLLAK